MCDIMSKDDIKFRSTKMDIMYAELPGLFYLFLFLMALVGIGGSELKRKLKQPDNEDDKC